MRRVPLMLALAIAVAVPAAADAQGEPVLDVPCPVYAIGVPGLVVYPDCPPGGADGGLAVPDPSVPVALVGRDAEGVPVPIGVIEPAAPPSPPFSFPTLAAPPPPEAPGLAAAPAQGDGGECSPAYRDCLPITDDLDCEDIGFSQIELVDPEDDPYGLDGAATVEDGITCNDD